MVHVCWCHVSKQEQNKLKATYTRVVLKFIITKLYWSLKYPGNANSKRNRFRTCSFKNKLTDAGLSVWWTRTAINKIIQILQEFFLLLYWFFIFFIWFIFYIFLWKIKAIESRILTTDKLTPDWNKKKSKLNLLKTRIVFKQKS